MSRVAHADQQVRITATSLSWSRSPLRRRRRRRVQSRASPPSNPRSRSTGRATGRPAPPSLTPTAPAFAPGHPSSLVHAPLQNPPPGIARFSSSVAATRWAAAPVGVCVMSAPMTGARVYLAGGGRQRQRLSAPRGRRPRRALAASYPRRRRGPPDGRGAVRAGERGPLLKASARRAKSLLNWMRKQRRVQTLLSAVPRSPAAGRVRRVFQLSGTGGTSGRST